LQRSALASSGCGWGPSLARAWSAITAAITAAPSAAATTGTAFVLIIHVVIDREPQRAVPRPSRPTTLTGDR